MAKSANIESIIKRVRDGLDETGREKIAEEVTKVIKNLPKTKTSSLDAETILKTLGEELLSRSDAKDFKIVFCKSENFIKVLFIILKTFWDCHKGNHRNEDGDAFTSHRSYEIGLFYLLTMMETKETIKATVETMMKTSIFNDYVTLLSEHLADDISYHTQEINLEALCRILLYLRKNHQSSVISFMRKLPKPIRPVLEDSSIGPMGILESPQPHIFEINESLNLNIKSVRVNSISLCFGSSMDKNKGKVIPKHSLQDDTWIHMGLYGMDLDLLDSNIIPTVPYDVVRSAEFYKVPELSVKFSLDQLPDAVMNALAVHEQEFVNCGEYFLRLSFPDEHNKNRMETSLKQRLKETAEHNARDRNADEEEHMKKKMSVITTPLNVQRLDSNPKPLIQNLDEKLAAMHKQAEDACEPLKGPVVVKNLDEKLAKMNATDNSSKWPEAKNEAPTKKAAVKVATAKAVATPTVSKRKAVKPIEYSDDDDDDVGEVTSPESRHVTQRRPGKARAVAQVRPKLSPAKSTIPEAQSQLQQGIPTKSQSTIATTTAAAMANRRVTLSRGKNAADVLTRLSTIQDKPESMQSVYQNSTQHMDVYDMPGSDDENDDLENRRMSSTGTKGRRSTTSTNTVSTATKARLSSAPGNKRKATPRKPAATSAAAKKQTRKGKQALNKNDDDDEENEEEDEVEVPVEQAEDSVTPYPDALVVTDKKGGVASSDTSTKPIALTTVLGSRVASIRGSNEGDNASVISQYGLSRHSTSMRSKPMTVLYPGMNANDHDGENESVKQSSVTAPWNLRPAPSVAKSTDDIENVVPIPDAWNKPKESAATVKQSSEPSTDKNKKSSSSVKTSGQSVVTTRATPLWKPAGPITSGARMRAPVPVLDTSAYEPMIGDENINADKKTPKATSATKSSKPTKKAVSDRTDAVNINDKENAGVNESTKRTTSVPSRVTRKALTPITEKEAEGEKERASSSILPAHDEQEDYDDGGQNDDNGFGFDGGNDSVVNDYEQPAPVEVEDPKVASKKSTGRGSQQNKENAGNEKKSTEKEPLSSSVTKHALRDSSTTRSSRIDPSPPDAPKASATPKAVLPTLTSSTTTTTTSMPVSSALSTGGEVAEKRGSGSSNSMLLNLSALPQKLISPPPMFGFSSAPAVQDPNQRPSVFDKIKQQLTASVSTSIPLSSTTADLKRSGVGSSREQVSKYAASTASGSDCGANSQHANEYIEPLDAFEPSQCQITEFVSPETNRSKRGRGGGALKADTDSDMDSPSHDHIQMILAQIERLQKSKAERKLKKKVRAAVQTASSHVQLYLDQWQDYVRAEGAHHSLVFEQRAEREYSAATALLHALDVETQTLLAEGGDLLSDLTALETEANSVVRELSAALRQWKDEEAALRRDLIIRKKRILEETKAAIAAEMRMGKQKAAARSNTGVMFMR